MSIWGNIFRWDNLFRDFLPQASQLKLMWAHIPNGRPPPWHYWLFLRKFCSVLISLNIELGLALAACWRANLLYFLFKLATQIILSRCDHADWTLETFEFPFFKLHRFNFMFENLPLYFLFLLLFFNLFLHVWPLVSGNFVIKDSLVSKYPFI